MRVIAVTNNQRFSGLPDVATCAEQGVPSMAYEGLAGMFGSRLIPADLRTKIGEDVVRVLADPAIKTRIEATGQMVLPGGAAFFQKSIESQMEEIKRTAEFIGLKAGKVAAP